MRPTFDGADAQALPLGWRPLLAEARVEEVSTCRLPLTPPPCLRRVPRSLVRKRRQTARCSARKEASVCLFRISRERSCFSSRAASLQWNKVTR